MAFPLVLHFLMDGTEAGVMAFPLVEKLCFLYYVVFSVNLLSAMLYVT